MKSSRHSTASHAPGRVRTRTRRSAASPVEPLAAPQMEFDLAAEAARLHGEEVYARSGRNAITLFVYPDLRVVLTALRARTRIPGHHAEGRLSIQVLSGAVRVHVATTTHDVAANGLLALDRGVDHDVEALEDAVFLLTIAPCGGQDRER